MNRHQRMKRSRVSRGAHKGGVAALGLRLGEALRAKAVILGDVILASDRVVGNTEREVRSGGVQRAQVLRPTLCRCRKRRRQPLALLVRLHEVGSLEDVDTQRGREARSHRFLVAVGVASGERRVRGMDTREDSRDVLVDNRVLHRLLVRARVDNGETCGKT